VIQDDKLIELYENKNKSNADPYFFPPGYKEA
jgi:hypothetical protein